MSSFTFNHKVFPGSAPSRPEPHMGAQNTHLLPGCGAAETHQPRVTMQSFPHIFPGPPGLCCFPGLGQGRAGVPFSSLSSRIVNTTAFSGTHQSHLFLTPGSFSLVLSPSSVPVLGRWHQWIVYSFCVCVLFGAAPAAYGGSQPRGPIRATAASHGHSHSNTRSELHL